MPTQAEKATTFRELHYRTKPLIVANPWDAGTACILTALGFEALSTTSGGLAITLGRRLSKPVNVLAALKGAPHFCVADLAALGVRRISLGSALSRAALSAFIYASREIKEKGTFTFAADTFSLGEITDFITGKA
jgi:2-methylisocitrate lyase-like PEP mutase family enzyme